MKILLLTQAFPPHPEVGAIRAANLAQAFREAGHQVIVVTEAVPDALPAEGVIPVELGPSYVLRVSRLLQKIRRFTGGSGDRGGDRTGSGGRSGRENEPEQDGPLRSLVLAALSVPDQDNHLIRPFYRAARGVLRQGADLIYSSAPPFSLHLVVRRLRREFAVPWVAEFRDPWYHPWTERLAGRHWLTRGIDARLERGVLTRADALVMVTEAARDFMAERLPASDQGKVLMARNGIPEWSERVDHSAKDSRDPFRIVHAGSLYMGRNPVGFFEGLARFVHASSLRPESLQVDLMGRCRDYSEGSVQDLLERLGLKDFVRIDDWLPHHEVRARLLAADALLLFAQNQPLQVPNKLYEYLGVGVPILAFVDREGESARVLRDLPIAHLFFEPGGERIAKVLERLVTARAAAGGAEERHPPPEGLSSRAQMRDLVAELTRRFAPR